MPLVSLRDLYIAELLDLLDAEQITLAELPALAAAATSTALRDLLGEHLEQTRIHAERLELLLRRLNADSSRASCDGMRGLIRDARRRIDACEKGDVLDAALIAAAQRIKHFEIAAYGCARTYARTLGDREAEGLLQQTLDEEGEIDGRLTRIAERGVNQSAGEGVLPDHDAQRSRLRYVPAGRIRGIAYGEFSVRDAANDEIGRVDGFVLDTRSGRPEYVVVDSGGWFVGQRFLVPIDALRADAESRTFRTDLERHTINAYPPFNPDAFAQAESGGETPDPGGETAVPNWLLTGVWMTEASGFASVPPRAETEPPAVERERAEAADRRGSRSGAR
jgi:ferritin-like metal-binding protein YciE